jgi:DNA-binding transcriptional LysR family regulator
MGGENAES